MKRMKLIGFIAVLAVMAAVSLTGCDNPDDNGDLDYAALDTAITNANAAKLGIQTSVDGEDVSTEAEWVTQAVMEAFNTAITAAQTVRANATEQTAVDGAATTLNAAICTFNGQKKAGTQQGGEKFCQCEGIEEECECGEDCECEPCNGGQGGDDPCTNCEDDCDIEDCDCGCDEPESNNQLPEPVGSNELAGIEYDNGGFIVNFKIDNSYTLSIREWESDITVRETGFYSWDTPQKIVFLKSDKTDQGFGLQDKTELKASYMEHFSSLPPEEIEERVPSNMTLEEYFDMSIEIIFSPSKYNYEIESNEITYLCVSVTVDTGTTIAGCAYSQMVATEGLGRHYLLDISFDEALALLTAEYGQPRDGWNLQSDSTLISETDWVILEFSRFRDMRLIKSEAGERTVKGWTVDMLD